MRALASAATKSAEGSDVSLHCFAMPSDNWFGSWLVGVFPVRDARGVIILAGAVLIEITERKRIEEDLRIAVRPDTGLTNGKLGTWVFLAFELMLFGSLFSSYALLRTVVLGPLDEQIRDEQHRAAPDTILVSMLKKQKLKIKEALARLT